MVPKERAAPIPNLVAPQPVFRLRRIPNFAALMGGPYVANLTIPTDWDIRLRVVTLVHSTSPPPGQRAAQLLDQPPTLAGRAPLAGG